MKNNYVLRALALLMTVVMLLTMAPASVFALDGFEPSATTEVDSAEELEAAIESGAEKICVTADFEIDRTYFITYDVNIYSEKAVTLTRKADFAGDFFVVGESSDGIVCEKKAVLSVGNEGATQSDMLTIDGNKSEMTVSVTGTIFFVCKNGRVDLYPDLTVKNCEKNGNERALDTKYSLCSERTIIGGSVGIVAEAKSKDPSYITDGVINIFGGKYIDNGVVDSIAATEINGGAFFNYGEMYVYDGHFEGGYASKGGVFYNYRRMYIYKATMQNNNSTSNGGAIYSVSSAEAVLHLIGEQKADGYDVVLKNNGASGGGAIAALGTIVMRNVLLDSNTASSTGGALYISGEDADAAVYNCKFLNNKSTSSSGGAIYAFGSADKDGNIIKIIKVVLKEVTAEKNYAEKFGGFMSSNYSDIEVSNCLIKENKANAGSAFYLANSTKADFYKVDIEENACHESRTGNAGAINLTGSDVKAVLHTCKVANNTSKGLGGGIVIDKEANLDIYNVTATGNSALKGGFMYETTQGTVVTISGLTVSGNTDSSGGPIIWGNTNNAKLFIDKSSYKDLDVTGELDDDYWKTAIHNKLTVEDTPINVPEHEDSIAANHPEVPHNYETAVVAPTCVNYGYTSYTCSCGDTYNVYNVAAQGHKKITDAAVAPGCTATGLTEGSSCSVCHEVYVAQEVVSALGHTEGEAVTENNVAPDCTNTGSYDTVVYCTVCDDELSRDTVTVDALGHDFAEKLINDAHLKESLGEQSVYYYNCTRCDVMSTEDTYVVLDAEINNKFAAISGITAGLTVEGAGTSKVTVINKDEITIDFSKADPSIGRNMDAWWVGVNVIAPSELTESELKEVKYRTGGQTKSFWANKDSAADADSHYITLWLPVTQEYIDNDADGMLNWNYEFDWDNNGFGISTQKVTITVDVNKINRIHSAGHTKVVEEDAVNPDCENAGQNEKSYCSVCGLSIGDGKVLDALGHTEGEAVTENNVAPDCTNTGSYDTVVYCTVCGDELSRDTVTVDALGHTEGEAVTENNVTPDCTNTGSYDTVVYCTVCGDELSRDTTTVDALGHSYKAVVTAPTCENAGYTTHTCSACGDSYVDGNTAALGHIWTNACDTICDRTDCDETRRITHAYDNACDADCNVCGATRTPAAHKGGTATCTAKAVCSVCSQPYGTVDDSNHSWKTTTYTWSTDGKTCTATRVCSVNSAHKETAKATVKSAVKTAAKCTTKGTTTYTATFSVSWAKKQTKDIQNIAALGHTYKTTTTKATFANSGSIKTACTVCSSVKSTTAVKYVKSATLSATSYTYDGNVKTPSVTVKDANGKVLKNGTDYTVSYASGRKNAGTYKVTVTLKGNYSGTKTLTFKINPINISTCSVKLSATSFTYNGSTKTPSVTVKNAKGSTLTNGTHYTVSYASGRKSVGQYKVTVTMKGNYSGTKTLTFNILPSKTSKITATQTTTTLKATWNKVTGASGYKVELLNASGKVVKSATTTKLTYTFSKLTAGTNYKVKVTAYKTISGKNQYSLVSTTLATATNPATPTLTLSSATKGKANLKWTNVAGENGYQVYYSTSKNGTYSQVGSYGANTVSSSKSKLTSGKTYYFKVRAYKKVGNTTIYGAWSSVKSVKIK